MIGASPVPLAKLSVHQQVLDSGLEFYQSCAAVVFDLSEQKTQL